MSLVSLLFSEVRWRGHGSEGQGRWEERTGGGKRGEEIAAWM